MCSMEVSYLNHRHLQMETLGLREEGNLFKVTELENGEDGFPCALTHPSTLPFFPSSGRPAQSSCQHTHEETKNLHTLSLSFKMCFY